MSLLASIPSELLKNWEGRVIDGQFRLQKWLGGSDHSAVFLTERNGKDPYKAAIKLVWTESLSTDLTNQDLLNQDSLNPDSLHEEAQLSRWRETAKLSHPHLIRLFESGRGTIDNRRFVYIVMEYAEEDLGQILPARALSSEEVAGMLPPTANAIQFLHQAGFVHGRIKPSNVMAVSDQLKISMDGLGRPGERVQAKSSYDAPELTSHRMTPAADVWSLGAMLVAVLTQDPPKVLDGSNQKALPAIPETMQEPFRSIARQCLRVDPEQRGTVNNILAKLNGSSSSPMMATSEPPAPAESLTVEVHAEPSPRRRWIALAIAIVVLIVGFFFSRRSTVHPTAQPQEVPSAQIQTTPGAASSSVPQSSAPAPPQEPATPIQSGVVPGRVLNQIAPEVSRGARNTIHGHLKVTVHLLVDASGNVSQATISSEGPSRYFAGKALAAARLWKFDPAKVNGQAAPSEWIVRFQFSRNGQQAVPSEVKP